MSNHIIRWSRTWKGLGPKGSWTLEEPESKSTQAPIGSRTQEKFRPRTTQNTTFRKNPERLIYFSQKIFLPLENIRKPAMVSCSRFIWITNSSDHRRVENGCIGNKWIKENNVNKFKMSYQNYHSPSKHITNYHSDDKSFLWNCWPTKVR